LQGTVNRIGYAYKVLPDFLHPTCVAFLL